VSRLNDSLESQFKLSFNSELPRWCAGVVEVCSGRTAALRGLKSLVDKAHDTQRLTRKQRFREHWLWGPNRGSAASVLISPMNATTRSPRV
jgi:hypothetical protein